MATQNDNFTLFIDFSMTQNKNIFQQKFADTATILVYVCEILLLFCLKIDLFGLNLHFSQ
jgi:hypothetical protein